MVDMNTSGDFYLQIRLYRGTKSMFSQEKITVVPLISNFVTLLLKVTTPILK